MQERQARQHLVHAGLHHAHAHEHPLAAVKSDDVKQIVLCVLKDNEQRAGGHLKQAADCMGIYIDWALHTALERISDHLFQKCVLDSHQILVI